MRRTLAAVSMVFLMSAAAPAMALVGTCGDIDSLSPENQTRARNVASESGSDFRTFTCQNVPDASVRSQRCVPNLCEGSTTIICCAPGTGGTEGSAKGADTPAAAAGGGGGFLRLELPACTKNGDCGLDDIVRTGVSFANLLFGISGAVLLATFVYGGVLYLTAGSSGNVTKAKDMIKNALIGMILVFGAGLLVSTVYDTFRADTGGGSDSCTSSKPGFSCQILQSSPTDAAAIQAEMTRRGCAGGDLCAGEATRRCCPD